MDAGRSGLESSRLNSNESGLELLLQNRHFLRRGTKASGAANRDGKNQHLKPP
jgi:hypothetical protein